MASLLQLAYIMLPLRAKWVELQGHNADTQRTSPITNVPITCDNYISLFCSFHSFQSHENFYHADQSSLYNDGSSKPHAIMAPTIKTLPTYTIDPHATRFRDRHSSEPHTLPTHHYNDYSTQPSPGEGHWRCTRHHDLRAQRHQVLHQEHRK